MPKYTDPNKRFRIRYEPSRKSKQYLVVFTKRWADKQDPNTSSPELRSKKSFETLQSAKHYANQKADLTDRLAGNLDTLSVSKQSQLIGLATELAETDTDPIKLLQEALRISRLSLDPIQSITQGVDLITLAEDNADKTIGYFMDKFFADPEQNKAVTASEAVSNLKHNFSGLRDIPVGVLINPKKAREAIQPVLQEYCDRPAVKRESSLKHQRSRLRQLLKYIQNEVNIPTDSDLNQITDLKKYQLNHNLIMPKEDYALTAAEILVMLKWFLRPESFCPYYPILCGLMGSRYSLFIELEWEHFGGKGRHANSTIKIPRGLLKTVRQGKSKSSVSFKTSAIPNLEVWLWFALYTEYETKFKKHGSIQKSLVRTLASKKVRREREECLQEWKHFFECSTEGDDEYTWQNVCENGFRNAFISYGVIHPVVKENVSLIANDAKSHSHYIDKNKPESDLEARVLFEMTPMYLNLVDLKNKTVDTKYLYASLEEKQKMYHRESNLTKKEIYRRILESHGIFPNKTSIGSEIINWDPEGVEWFENATKTVIEDNSFWENTTKDKMLYFLYDEANQDESVEQYLQRQISRNTPEEKAEDRI
ncbi:hypothetical protein N8641_01080 [Akkermansiaceae bacterium]|nr:hypothetical protein [Akkermansiaceae bacterium]